MDQLTLVNKEGKVIGHSISIENRERLESIQNSVIQDVKQERNRQDAKWGIQNHSISKWIGILGEEFGELCEAINETVLDNATKREKGGYENMRTEAIQIAAVAVSFVEYLDRNKEKNII